MHGIYDILGIDSDPTPWVRMSGTPIQDLVRAGDPVVLPILSPVMGRLVLAPQVASTVSSMSPPGPGWIPSHFEIPQPRLYVPSSAPQTGDLGYALLSGVDLRRLEDDITNAMQSGTVLTVDIEEGVLLLNGATLSFAVIIPAT